MFLNNYWKAKAAMDTNPRTFWSNSQLRRGVLTGAKNTSGTSTGMYIVTSYSSGIMSTTTIANQAGIQDRLIGQGNSVKIATGDSNISADDYIIAGTDITSDFSNLSITTTIGTENGGETYVCAIVGVYNGVNEVEVTKIGITKTLDYISSAEVSGSTLTTTQFLMVEHELTQPITLNNGDPLNIVLKVTQA